VTTELWFRLLAVNPAANAQEPLPHHEQRVIGTFAYSSYASATNFKKISAGNWNTAADWTPTGVPGAGDNTMVLGAASMNAAAARRGSSTSSTARR